MADDRAFTYEPKFTRTAELARQDISTGISVAMSFIGMTCVCLRVYTRVLIVRNMGIEDWTIVVAAVFTLVFLIQLIISARAYGAGLSIQYLTPLQMQNSAKMGLAAVVVYKTTVTLIKISILMIYLRLAVTRSFERICKGSIYLLAIYQLTVIVVVPAECRPLRKAWDITISGHCIDINVYYYITSAFHIAMDIWILILPYKLILSIPRPTREKLVVYAVFGIGIFGTICAIVRFYYLVAVTHSADPFYDSLDINTWSIIEVNVGIVCASLPTLRPLFSKAQRHRTMEALNISQKKQGSKSSKRGGLTAAKELFITITAASLQSNKGSMFDDEVEMLEDHPPPVPPKDAEVASSIVSTASVRTPNMALERAWSVDRSSR